MAVSMPKSELLKKAIQYAVEEMRKGRSIQDIVDNAGMMFNLSPLDQESLARELGRIDGGAC